MVSFYIHFSFSSAVPSPSCFCKKISSSLIFYSPSLVLLNCHLYSMANGFHSHLCSPHFILGDRSTLQELVYLKMRTYQPSSLGYTCKQQDRGNFNSLYEVLVVIYLCLVISCQYRINVMKLFMLLYSLLWNFKC